MYRGGIMCINHGTGKQVVEAVKEQRVMGRLCKSRKGRPCLETKRGRRRGLAEYKPHDHHRMPPSVIAPCHGLQNLLACAS